MRDDITETRFPHRAHHPISLTVPNLEDQCTAFAQPFSCTCDDELQISKTIVVSEQSRMWFPLEHVSRHFGITDFDVRRVAHRDVETSGEICR